MSKRVQKKPSVRKTKKSNIMILYDDRKKKQKMDSDSESEMSPEPIIKKPTSIIKKIINENEELIQKQDSISKIFNYENIDILIIVDNDKIVWYRANDIASILQYECQQQAIRKHITSDHKKSYAEIGIEIKTSGRKIDSQTIFINDQGLWCLISRSKKLQARNLWTYVTTEVLPTLFATGTYTLPPKKIDIERLTKSYYDDHLLSNLMDKDSVYLLFVGEHYVMVNGVKQKFYVLKFGITHKFDQRDLKQHRKFYPIFNVLKVWESLANIQVEDQLKKNFAAMGVMFDVKIKGLNDKIENRKEHIVLTEKFGLDDCIKIIDEVVNKTINPLEIKYIEKIKELENKNEIIDSKHDSTN